MIDTLSPTNHALLWKMGQTTLEKELIFYIISSVWRGSGYVWAIFVIDLKLVIFVPFQALKLRKRNASPSYIDEQTSKTRVSSTNHKVVVGFGGTKGI